MAVNGNQSAVNLERNFWVSATPGISSATQFLQNPVPYLDQLIWEQNTGNPTVQTALSGNLATYTDVGLLYYSNEDTINPVAAINVDATAQNFVAGLNVSTLIYSGAGFYSGGLGTGGNSLVRQQVNTNNELYAQWQDRVAPNASTMKLVYLNQSFLPDINGTVVTYDPTAAINGEVQIPYWTLSTSALNVSSINGQSVGATATSAQSFAVTPASLAGTVPTNTVTALGTFALSNAVPADSFCHVTVPFEITLSNAVAGNVSIGVNIGDGGGGGGQTYVYQPVYGVAGSNGQVIGGTVSGILRAGDSNLTQVEVVAYQDTGANVIVDGTGVATVGFLQVVGP